MSDSEEHRPPSWWSTLPGILTGVAALITALAGLFFGLVQLNSQGTAATTVKSSAAANPARPAQSSSPETAVTSAPLPPSTSPTSPSASVTWSTPW
ncbi:hypothetical protein [Sinomonas atrocyanea]